MPDSSSPSRKRSGETPDGESSASAARRTHAVRHVSLDSCQLAAQIATIRDVALTTGCLVVRGSRFEQNWRNMQRVQCQLDEMYLSPDKNSIGNVYGLGATRGFFPIGAETGDKKNAEPKESFSFGHDGIPQEFKRGCNLVADNMWPAGFEREAFQQLILDLNQTVLDMVKLLQLAFPELDLLATVDETTMWQSFARSFKYYPTEGATAAQLGNSLHTDWNLLTLVWTDKPGLQVLYEDEYIDYHDEKHEYSLICNFGDFLSSISHGKIRSPWHRVVLAEQQRNSLVYFSYPRCSHPVVTHRVYNEDRLLGLFVNQSTADKTPWTVPEGVENMGQMYASKWTQVSNY